MLKNVSIKSSLALFAFIPLLAICFFVFVFALNIDIETDCGERENSVPEVPIYPQALLASEEFHDDITDPSIAYDYTTIDSVEDIIAFYETRSFCRFRADDNNWICTGDANPFGSYIITIYPPVSSQEATRFHIIVRWKKCISSW